MDYVNLPCTCLILLLPAASCSNQAAWSLGTSLGRGQAALLYTERVHMEMLSG